MTTAPGPEGLPARLRRLAVSNTAVVGGTVLLSNALRIVSSMVLTRLLDASAFGVAGIIYSVSFVLTMISDVGLYPYIVRHDRSDRDFFDEVWTIRLLRSLVLMLVMLVLAWPIAQFMQKPQLAPVLMVWSLYFLFDGLSSLAFASAVRGGMLARLSLMELLVAVIQLVVAVAAALIIRSYWALVVGMLASVASKAALSYMLFPDGLRRWRPDRARARELWAFSRNIALSSILTMLILQSDKVVLARLLPLADYGLYAIAVTLAAAPAAVVRPYAQRVLYPAFVAVARDSTERVAALFYPKRRIVVVGYMAAVGGLIGAAPLVIELLYDARYRAVTPYLQLLAISTMLAMPNQVAEEALIALGRTRATLFANICRTVWLFVGGAIAFMTGGVTMLVVVIGTMEVAAMGCHWINLRRVHILKLREEALGLAAGGVAVLLAGVAARAILAWWG